MNTGLYLPPFEQAPQQAENDRQLTQFFVNNRYAIVTFALLTSLGIGLIAALFDPLVALGAAVALSISLIAILRPEMTTVFIAFVFYANLPVVVTRFGVPTAVAGSVFLALGLPLLYTLLVKRDRLIINTGLVMMVAYLGVILLSAIFSQDYTRSTERIIGFVLEGIILYFLFINTIRTPETLKKVIWALIAAGILMGSLSMIQEATGNYDNDFFGMAQTKEAEVSVGTADFFDEKPTARRLAGPIGSKNRYAQVMLVLFPLAALRFWADSNRALKMIGLLAVVPIAAGILLTYSRAAGLTLIAILFAMAFLRLFPLWKFIAIGVIGFMVVAAVLPGFVYRLGSVTEVTALFSGDADEADGAIRGRATVNLVAIEIIKMNPLLGVGPGQSPLFTRSIGNEVGYRWLTTDRRLHNMYLEEGADTGLIGLGVFLAILFVKLKMLNDLRLRWREKNPEYYYTVISILLAIFSYMMTAAFLHLSYVRYYWFLLALAGAVICIYSNQPEPEKESSEG